MIIIFLKDYEMYMFSIIIVYTLLQVFTEDTTGTIIISKSYSAKLAVVFTNCNTVIVMQCVIHLQ